MSTPTLQENHPTGPGLYEYRWKYGSSKMRLEWIPVEVIEKDGELFVIDPGCETPSKLGTYSGAIWRKIEQ